MFIDHKSAGKTHIGLVRTGNEDYLYLDKKNAVYAVCDGMGGHKAGEVASRSAADTLHLVFHELREPLLNESRLDVASDLPDSTNLLVKAIRLANRQIHNQASSNSAESGMGTTVVAVAFEDDIISIAHVGDSRVYRLEKDKTVSLTVDHSWVAEVQRNSNISEEEAGSIVGKNVITRALGVREHVEVDYQVMKVKPGDIYILCSDGLCGFASDNEIFEAASPIRHDVHKIVDGLIKLANDKGGHDNVTVIAIQVMDVKKTDRPELETVTTVAENNETLEVEDEWLEAMGDAREVMENSDSKPSSPKNVYLFAIFGVFIILAVIIIYLTSFK